jgi:glutathione reductase (NADPH)
MNSESIFDLIVIGTGSAASVTAHECRSKGWSVAIIDSLPFGGTCPLRGCDPKKVLVEAAKIIDSNQRHQNKGISSSQDHLPDRIVFVGGGYISFEFAHIAARAGVKKITILHRGKQPLEHFDLDLVNQLVQRSRDVGINVQLGRTVKKIEKLSDGKFIVVHSSSNVSDTFLTTIEEKMISNEQIEEDDLIVHGAGRIPNIEGLNLIAGNIEHTKGRGIKVNEYLQSVSNPSVYAAGDVSDSGGLPLTPVASYEGGIVANNLINGNTLKSNYAGLPSVVFTIPTLTAVGMQEKEAKQRGLQFRTKYDKTDSWASSKRVGETCSGFKVLIEKDTDRILGAHILGPHAEEIINIFSLAIRLGLSAKDLKDPILYAYPTNSSDVVYML